MGNETIFSLRLKEEIDRTNKSVNQIERELGYPRNALHNYQNTTGPSGKRLIELAEYFGVSPKYLIGQEDDSKIEINLKKEMEKLFQKLSVKEKKELSLISQNWLIDHYVN